MKEVFRPSALEIARLRRSLTWAELSKRSGLSTRELRRASAGEVQPSAESVARIADALGYPIDFFYADDCELPVAATFRGLCSMTKREKGAGLASGALAAHLSAWLEEEFDVPEPAVPDLTDTKPDFAAKTLREFWGLGERPIGNLIRLLESKGVHVFSLSEKTLRLDAFATWMKARPLIFLNGMKSSEHSRFDAAHELGHLCLHRDGQQGKSAEDEANAFAAAFLMPAGDILAHRVYPTMERLIAKKARWGVALSALVRRYRDLELIKEERAKWLYIEMSRKGYLKCEPRPMPRETSSLWTQVLQALWQERKSVNELARDVALPVDEVASLIFVNREGIPRDFSSGPATARNRFHTVG